MEQESATGQDVQTFADYQLFSILLLVNQAILLKRLDMLDKN